MGRNSKLKTFEVFKIVSQNFTSVKMVCEELLVNYRLYKYQTAPVGLLCCFEDPLTALHWGVDMCDEIDFLILRCKTNKVVQPDNAMLPFFNKERVDLKLIKSFWQAKDKDAFLEKAVEAERCNFIPTPPGTVYCRALKPVEVYSNPTIAAESRAELPEDLFDEDELDFSSVVPLTEEQIQGIVA